MRASHPDLASIVRRAAYKRAATYLAKIAVVLRYAQNQMLTFVQLMESLTPLISDDRKCVENNIRMCLSNHRCFIKIPMIPDSLSSKKNYWKLDYSQVTAKMVRRHFKGLLPLFPELACKLEMEKLTKAPKQDSVEPAPCSAVRVKPEVKFTGPFSIESLLKRDRPSAGTPGASPQSSKEQHPKPTHPRSSSGCDPEEPLFLLSPTGFSHISPMGVGVCDNFNATRTIEPIRRIAMLAEPSSAPYFSSSQSSYVTYSVPVFTRVTPHVWQ